MRTTPLVLSVGAATLSLLVGCAGNIESRPVVAQVPVARTEAAPPVAPPAPTAAATPRTLKITLALDGTTRIDEKLVPSDEALVALARAAREEAPDLRAVINADSAVTHGRVVHVMDLLKQAGVQKMAFGVAPAAP